MFKKETEIKAEIEEKINIFFEKIFQNILNNQNSIFTSKDYINIIFECVYRFKKIPSSDILKKIQIFLNNPEKKNFISENFSKNEILKLCFLLCKHENLSIDKLSAKSSLDYLSEILLSTGLENLTNEEIKTVILNYSKNNLNPNIELFTLLEPYIIKGINSFNFKSMVLIFVAYLKNFRGTDFFIKTLGFYVNSRLKEAELNGKIIFFYFKIS